MEIAEISDSEDDLDTGTQAILDLKKTRKARTQANKQLKKQQRKGAGKGGKQTNGVIKDNDTGKGKGKGNIDHLATNNRTREKAYPPRAVGAERNTPTTTMRMPDILVAWIKRHHSQWWASWQKSFGTKCRVCGIMGHSDQYCRWMKVSIRGLKQDDLKNNRKLITKFKTALGYPVEDFTP
jgi:hypothetical protein